MPQIRIKPGMPCKGVSLPHAHVTHAWRHVDEATAEHASKVRLHASNDRSPLVFEFADDPLAAQAEAPKESTEPGSDDEQTEAVVAPDGEESVDEEDADETDEVEEATDDSTEVEVSDDDAKSAPSKSKRASRKSRRALAAQAEAPKESTEPGK